MDTIFLPEQCRLGYLEFDLQHDVLFTLFREIAEISYGNTPVSGLPIFFSAIKDYITSHFQYEEELMAGSNYPEEARHREEHQRFFEEIKQFESRFGKEDSTLCIKLASDVSFHLYNWIKNHISIEDRKLCQFFAPKLTPTQRDSGEARNQGRASHRRRHRRVLFETSVTITFGNDHVHYGTTYDISISGLRVTDLDRTLIQHVGGTAKLMIKLPVGETSYKLSLTGQILRADPESISLRFLELDHSNYELINRFLKEQTDPRGSRSLLGSNGTDTSRLEHYEVHTRILKSELPEHLAEAVKDMFVTYMGQTVQAISTVAKEDFEDYAPPEAELTGIINFSGSLEGGIHLSSPLHVGLRIASLFGGEEYGTVDDYSNEALDAFGEVCNILSGGLTEKIAHIFNDIHLAPPYVISGGQLNTHYDKRLSSVKIYFNSSMGPFLAECFFMI